MEQNRTILVVDDEPEALKGYTDFLAPSNEGAAARKSSRHSQSTSSLEAKDSIRVLVASSGEQAIELVKAEMKAGGRVAAGFFDVKLGNGMDGLSAIQAIRALDKDIHCVVVTAYHDRTVDEIAGLFGGEFSDQWDYLNKPFSKGEIVQKARQMLSAWNRKVQIKVMNEQLVRSERLAGIGQIARGVGHEFGNILLRIMGKTDLALMEKDAAKIQEHLKVIMSATERASVIVRNLQSVSRASKVEPEYKNTSLTTPLEESISLVNHELTKASVKLERCYATVPSVRIDVGAMGQVFLNLLINAVHAMPQGGQITVTVAEACPPDFKPGVLAKVKDTGAGIPPDVLPRIFEFAFTTKGDKGSGLGLAISKEIVEAQGGLIFVQTEPGKGSEFTIWLPVGVQ